MVLEQDAELHGVGALQYVEQCCPVQNYTVLGVIILLHIRFLMFF